MESQPVESLVDDDLEFFANCSVKEQREQIKDKLKNTLQQRIVFVADKVDLYKAFPFYFFDPTLVKIYLNCKCWMHNYNIINFIDFV